MKILVLHAVPYRKIKYHRGIDHTSNEVTYIGTEEKLQQIPDHIPCKKIVRCGRKALSEEVLELVSPADNFDLVISLSEFELLEAGIVREKLDVSGPRYADLLHVRDKMVMKEVAARAGIRVPKNMQATALQGALCQVRPGPSPWNVSAIENLIPWSGKIVLKPTMGASSDGIVVHDGVEGLIVDLCERIARGESLEALELEEFISGPILHVDGIIGQNEIKTMVCSRYIGNCLDYALGKPLASIQIPISESYLKWFKHCLTGMRITEGAFHLEIIESAHGLVFLEIANRVGGADVIDVTELKTGVHLPTAELRVLLQGRRLAGRDCSVQPSVSVSDCIDNSAPWFGWFVFPGHLLESRKCKINVPGWVHDSPNIVKFTALAEGTQLPDRITYQDWEVPVAGIVQGRDERELTNTVQRIFNEVHISEA
jgi:hypothetical protein